MKAVNRCIERGIPIDVTEIKKQAYNIGQSDTRSRTAMLDWITGQVPLLNIKDSTRRRYWVLVNRLKEYGKLTAWQDLSVESIYMFDAWLHRLTKVQSNGDIQAEREEVTISDAGVYNYHRTLGALLKRAAKFGIIEKNPYESLRGEFRKGIKESTEFLSEEEIAAIESLHPMEGTQMAMARDLFLFQVYTGLAYSDAEAFDIADYKKVNGKWVNVGNRIKTGVPYVSQLMPQVVEILERYGMQTPKVNNVQYNASLKVIQRALGIKTRLHSHLGRHTFGTRMQALGAKLENVQRMMGHRDIRMTQRYAKVLAESVRDDFAMVEEKLKVNKTLTKVNGGGKSL
jgi:integrase